MCTERDLAQAIGSHLPVRQREKDSEQGVVLACFKPVGTDQNRWPSRSGWASRYHLPMSHAARGPRSRLGKEPAAKGVEDVLLLLFRKRMPFRDRVPLLETPAATAGRRVLGDEDRVVAHRRLLAVVLR